MSYEFFVVVAAAAAAMLALTVCGVLADIVLPRCGRARRFFERLFAVELEAECEKAGRQHCERERAARSRADRFSGIHFPKT